MSGRTFILAMNHLLADETWARSALKPHAGRVIEMRLGTLDPFELRITPEGMLDTADDGAPALTVDLKSPPWNPAVMGQRLADQGRFEGDPQLADALRGVFRDLRWDPEHELSRWIGDVAAHRIAGAGRTLSGWHADAQKRVSRTVGDRVAEIAQLVERAEAVDLGAQIDATDRQVDALAARIEQLRSRIGAT